jgi:hypothetical protein
MSSLKERGRSIPAKKLVWVLWVVPSVQAGGRQPADGVRVERPQRSEDERLNGGAVVLGCERLLSGQPAGEHHTKRPGAGELFVKAVPSLARRGGRRLVG